MYSRFYMNDSLCQKAEGAFTRCPTFEHGILYSCLYYTYVMYVLCISQNKRSFRGHGGVGRELNWAGQICVRRAGLRGLPGGVASRGIPSFNTKIEDSNFGRGQILSFGLC